MAVGINHKTSSIESREKFFLGQMERKLLLSAFKNEPSVIAAIILSTCNRCEIYVNVDDDYTPLEILKKLFSIKHQPQTQALQKLFYVLEGAQAVEHLLRVACGLDSLILGEKQILGQIKDAVLLSRQNLMMDKTFNVLTNFVLETGKKARRETLIDFGGSSVSWASVMIAQDMLGTLRNKTVLILGSGKMGRLAVQQLNNKGVKKIYIMNRTMEKAEELAKNSNGIAVPFWEMPEILPKVDVCICSSSCPHYLIDKNLVELTMQQKNGHKLLCIDISMPRNIDPQIAGVTGVSLLTVDDLERVVQDNIQKRLGAAQQVERIVLNKVREFYGVIDKIRRMEDNNTLKEMEMKTTNGFLGKTVMACALLSFLFWVVPASADLAQIKAYKEINLDAKPKCIECHLDEHPKKEDGKHDPNAYGAFVIAASKKAGLDKPTADTYKSVGTIEDFAKNPPAAK